MTDPIEAESQPDPLEALVAECIETPDALGAICRAHPEHAPSIHRRLESLRRLGFHGEPAPGADPTTPRAFGRYRILEKLGQGGMGIVYLALDERLGRKVALKAGVLPWSSNERARARFEREVRAAAQLEHPRIVPIFDVGEADGVPFFTMQYVEGATLASMLAALRDQRIDYADLATVHLQRATARHPAPTAPDAARLDSSRPDSSRPDTARSADVSASGGGWGKTYVESVCRIAIDVADALEHAHENGVVHRDVKPSNILVARDGRAQIFDLGLAHLDDEPTITRTGDFAGTPQYVSPEQIAGRPEAIDHRTDVYSLGVTLYEMLTLRAPFVGRNTQAVFKQILTREPQLLRRWNPLVPRDLETICLTALEKDPARRYPSAGELALDLRRFLSFQPVHARPTHSLRRGLRWLRRNPAIGAAAALGAVMAIGTPIGLLWANALIAEQRDKAERAAVGARFEAARAEQVADFLVELFHSSGGEEITAREMLERGAARIDSGLDGQPLVQAALMESVGRVWQNLGFFERALPLLDPALAIRQRELGENNLEVARLLHTLAIVHAGLGDDATVEALARRAEASFEGSGNARHAQAALCQVTLGDVALRRGELSDARARYERALALQRELLGTEDRAVADTLDRIGRLELAAVDAGDGAPSGAGDREALARAERALREALSIRKLAWDPAPEDIAASWSAIAEVEARRGELEAARASAANALAIDRRVLGDRHPETLRLRLAVADLALRAGDCDAACAEVETVAAGAPGAELAARLAAAFEACAACFERAGRTAEAASAEDSRARHASVREGPEGIGASVGSTRAADSRPLEDSAQSASNSAAPARRSSSAVRARETSTPYDIAFQSGITALQSGRYGEAIAAFETCLAIDPRRSVCAYNLACAHALRGDREAGLAWLDRAIDLGFGLRPNAFDSMPKDTDLENLRGDPRFARAIERMVAVSQTAEVFAARAALYVPEKLVEARAWPLLVVLHADGSTKDELVAGPWRAVADELGLALLAPSGRFPSAGAPAQGMRWFDDATDYEDRPWLYERPVIDALRAIRGEHAIARDRIVIAGEGSGARLALRIASRAPGLYRAVLLEGGLGEEPLLPVLDEGAARTLSALGLPVRVLLPPGAGDAAAGIEERFAEWQLDGEVETLPRETPLAARRRVETLRALLGGS